jgi:rubrerythrin
MRRGGGVAGSGLGETTMITKKELLEKLAISIGTEEDAIRIYSHHLKAILPWSGLPKKDQAAVKDLLDGLMDDSERHRKTLIAMREQIMSTGVDDVH